MRAEWPRRNTDVGIRGQRVVLPRIARVARIRGRAESVRRGVVRPAEWLISRAFCRTWSPGRVAEKNRP